MTNQQLKKKYHSKIKKLIKILKNLDPEKIILFGSAAQGKINKDSDIDICMIKKTKDKWKVKSKISNLLWNSDFDWEIEPDIKIYPPSVYYDWLSRNDPFIKEIEKGKVLYEKR